MAAIFVRALTILTLILVTAAAYCAELQSQNGPSAIARENLIVATSQLGDAMDSCSADGVIIGIPNSGSLGVRREALLLGVSYFHTKRYNECIAPAAKEFLLAAKVLQMSMASGGADRTKLEEKFELVDIVLDGWWDELEYEFRYRDELSATERTKIENIDGFRKPFDMIRSWNLSEADKTHRLTCLASPGSTRLRVRSPWPAASVSPAFSAAVSVTRSD